mmetsp:Transcript_14440/g.27910  ORF Transcript_14440/g.27910 Transcript_14440/m.27910 type:complete len:256 (-) Transcript_14440:476-1243(-)
MRKEPTPCTCFARRFHRAFLAQKQRRLLRVVGRSFCFSSAAGLRLIFFVTLSRLCCFALKLHFLLDVRCDIVLAQWAAALHFSKPLVYAPNVKLVTTRKFPLPVTILVLINAYRAHIAVTASLLFLLLNNGSLLFFFVTKIRRLLCSLMQHLRQCVELFLAQDGLCSPRGSSSVCIVLDVFLLVIRRREPQAGTVLVLCKHKEHHDRPDCKHAHGCGGEDTNPPQLLPRKEEDNWVYVRVAGQLNDLLHLHPTLL